MGRPQVPCFVFKADDDKYFFDVLRQTWVEEDQIGPTTDLTWLEKIISAEALHMGWLLVYEHRKKFSIIQLSTGRRVRLPYLHKLQHFIYRFSSPPPAGYVVAIHMSHGYFRTCRPGIDAAWSPKHKLFPISHDHNYIYNGVVDEVDDPSVYDLSSSVNDAVLCGQNIYAATKTCVVAIDTTTLSKAAPKVTCFPLKSYVMLQLDFLVESEGQLYQFWWSMDCPGGCGVRKWGSSSHVWEDVATIGNRLFMIGYHYSASLPALPHAKSASGTVYFLSEKFDICSFNLQLRSLATHYHCLDFQRTDCFDWLVIEEDHASGEEKGVEEVIEYPNCLMARTPYINKLVMSGRSNRPVAMMRRGADPVTWTPKTPWLMFANGYNDPTFKFIDPCSSSVHELDIPELVNKRLQHATHDGWILVLGAETDSKVDPFLFNPFTRARISFFDGCKMLWKSQYAFSSSPSTPGSILFFICPLSAKGGLISVSHLGITDCVDKNASKIVQYHNTDPLFRAPLSNPVYHNGLFYCVASDGNFGVYDPAKDTWVVKDGYIPFDPSNPVEKCYLIKLDDEDNEATTLVSVFINEKHNLIGIYRWNDKLERWNEIQDIGDKTLFVGPSACFSATAPSTEMANHIFCSMFVGDCGNEIFRYRLNANINTNTKLEGPLTLRDRYMQLWVQPKGVKFAYDRTTGKNIIPY